LKILRTGVIEQLLRIESRAYLFNLLNVRERSGKFEEADLANPIITHDKIARKKWLIWSKFVLVEPMIDGLCGDCMLYLYLHSHVEHDARLCVITRPFAEVSAHEVTSVHQSEDIF
jgi:hypothetical protein